MRKMFQRIMAGAVSVAMACSLMLGGLGLEPTQAEGEAGGDSAAGDYATITVSFQDPEENGDASEGEVQITTGAGVWVKCEAGQPVSASAVRIVPNEGKRIDWAATRLSSESGIAIAINGDTEIQNALKSENGYSLTDGTVYALTGVEFADDNTSGGASGDPNTGNQGSWENAYDGYLAAGVNILSTWIGSSVGDITYEFSNNASTWSGGVKLTNADV